MLKRALLLAAAFALPLAPAAGGARRRRRRRLGAGPPAERRSRSTRPQAGRGAALRLGLERGDRALDHFTGTGYYAEIMARAVGPQGRVTGWNTPAFARNERNRARRWPASSERSPNTSFFSAPVDGAGLRPSSASISRCSTSSITTLIGRARASASRGSIRTPSPAHDLPVAEAGRDGRSSSTMSPIPAATPAPWSRRCTGSIRPIVRADFERAGFVFDGESDLLRNPEDDHSKNVFDPSIRGRTDRFVYRFRRPAR